MEGHFWCRIICLLCIQLTIKAVQIDVSKTITTKLAEAATSTSTEMPTTLNVNASILTTPTVASTNITLTSTQIPSTLLSNATNSTSSLNNNATTTTNSTKTFLDDETMTRQLVRQVPHSYYCSCDLMVNFCDINCCCDIDCNETMYRSFECIEELWNIYDYDYKSGGLQSCHLSNDLFCIARDNEDVDTAHFDIKLLQQKQTYTWPSIFSTNSLDTAGDRETYKSGDSVLVFDEREENIKSFDIPFAISSGSQCTLNVPIKYFHDQQTRCRRNKDDLEQFLSDFKSKLQNWKILKSRKYINNPIMVTEHCTDPNIDCLQIELFDCVGRIASDHCHRYNQTEYDIDGDRYVNQEIIIHFRHNFTNLLNCSVFIVHKEALTPLTSFIHSIRVRFLQINETMKGVHKVSGNVGYVRGKPIIISNLAPANATLDEDKWEMLLDYFNENKTFSNNNYFMKIPSFDDDTCVLTPQLFETIKFNEQLHLKCNVLLFAEPSRTTTNASKSSEQNFTKTCEHFQRQIFHFLINNIQQKPNESTYEHIETVLSEFGSPRNDTKGWIKFATKNPLFEQVNGLFDKHEKSNEFVCENMILSVKYEFMFATLMVNGVKEQNVLKRVIVEWGTRLDLKFKLDEQWKVPIYFDVRFFDLTSGQEGRPFLRSSILLFISVISYYLI